MGKAARNLWEVTDEDFVQPRALWKVLGTQKGQQDNFVYNVSTHLCGAVEDVRRRTYEMFSKIDEELGRRIEENTEKRAGLEQKRDNVVEGILKKLKL